MALRIRLAAALLVSLFAGLAAFRWAGDVVKKAPPELTAAEFTAEVEQGHVTKIVVDEDRTSIVGTSSARGQFRAKLLVDKALVAKWRSRGIAVEIERFFAAP